MTPLTRTRIAPSPTGYPHIGTLFQAVVNYALAKKDDGQFIVRIEDTDQSRFVPDAEKAILDALAWAGIYPDESPLAGGPYAPYRQSERLDLYRKYAQELIAKGHAYYCFCSQERLASVRTELQKQGKPPMYDRHCRDLDPKKSSAKAQTTPHVIRMKIPPDETITVTDGIRGDITFDSNLIDDQVLLKSDGYPTYHLAVVVDDRLMKITHIVRGEEWISSAPKHVLLYRFFDWPMPHLLHTPLLRNPNKSKLSKRHGHASVSWYRNEGYLPEAVVNFLATRVWNHPEGKEMFPLDDFVRLFDIKDMHIQGPIIDLDKLNWLNGLWIRSLDESNLIQVLKPFLPPELDEELLIKLLPLVKDRLVKLTDIVPLTAYFIAPPDVESGAILKQSKLETSATIDYLKKVLSLLSEISSWTASELEQECRELQQSLQLKPKNAFMTLRIVLTGETATPPLFDVMVVLGREEVRKRLEASISKLEN